MDLKKVVIAILSIALVLLTMSSVSASSGFPTSTYPYSQYGHEYRYYDGPWGERMVYGAYGYFPNPNGHYPYGYRQYGNMYTPWNLRYGQTSCGACGGGAYGRSYGRAY